MNSKFKEGERVSLTHEGKKYIGKIFIIDATHKGYRYDIMCSKPDKILIKHVFEDEGIVEVDANKGTVRKIKK